MRLAESLVQLSKISSLCLVTTPLVLLYAPFVEDIQKFFHYVFLYGVISAVTMIVSMVAANIVDEL